MSRTNSAAVILVLNDDYGPKANGTLPDLTPYIDTANSMVNRLVVAAAAKGQTLSAADLELIERWVSAWAYALSDKPYQSRSTQGGSGSFQGQAGMGLEANLYGQTALRLDWTFSLQNIDKQQVAGAIYLGKPASDQLTWEQRN